jgi:uncharacterized membrane protein (UPF0127 family)
VFAACLVAVWVSLSHRGGLRTPNGTAFGLSRAVTEQEQIKGLSGTRTLPADRGMIFPYANDQERCFWMKGMNYSLDIIWVNARKQVVSVQKNLSPATYPRTFCAQGQYIIELNAGVADKSGISKGQTLNF